MFGASYGAPSSRTAVHSMGLSTWMERAMVITNQLNRAEQVSYVGPPNLSLD